MERRELKVEIREGVGKGVARRLRQSNKIPAIFYGPHLKNPVSLAIDMKELSTNIQSGKNTLFTLKTEGQSPIAGKMALVKQQQYNPITMKRTHVDLYEVRMDEKIKVNVPLIFTGKAKGIAEGGILQHGLRELEVRCLPTDIPEKIEVDVSDLAIGDSLHVSDLTLPQGITSVGEIDYTVAAVVPPEKEEVAAPVLATTEAGAPVAAAGTAAPAPAVAGQQTAKPEAAKPKEK